MSTGLANGLPRACFQRPPLICRGSTLRKFAILTRFQNWLRLHEQQMIARPVQQTQGIPLKRPCRVLRPILRASACGAGNAKANDADPRSRILGLPSELIEAHLT